MKLDEVPKKAKAFTSCIVLFLFCLLFQNCNNNPAPSHIPEDATFVLALDFPALSQDALAFEDLIRELMFEDSKNSKDFISQLINSGINLDKKAYFYARSIQPAEQSHFAFGFELDSEEAFIQKIKEFFPDLKEGKENNLRYFQQEGLIVGWEAQRALCIFAPMLGSEATLKTLFLNQYQLPKSQYLERKNGDFKNLLNKNYEIAYWLDYQKLQKNPSFLSGSIQIYLETLFSYSESLSGVLKFKQGALLSDFFYRAQTESYSEIDGLFKPKHKGNLLQGLPVESPILMMCSGLDMSELRNKLDEAHLLDDLKKFSRVLEISMDDIFTITNGDVAVVIDDFVLRKYKEPYLDLALIMRVENTETLHEVLKKAFIFVKRESDHFILKNNNQRYYLIERDGLIYLCSTRMMRDRILAREEALDPNLRKLKDKDASYFFLDFEKFKEHLPDHLEEELPLDLDPGFQKDDILPFLKSIEVKVQDKGKGLFEGEMRMELNDEDRNALPVFIEYFESLFLSLSII